MKKLPYILIALLVVAVLWGWLRPKEAVTETRVETRTRTEYRVETLLISAPMPVFWTFTGETIKVNDSVVLPRQRVVYEDSMYRAVVSGYHPRLDEISVYPRTILQTVTNDVTHTVSEKPKRWGLGIQVGAGYPGGWYVGVGVSYDLWQW